MLDSYRHSVSVCVIRKGSRNKWYLSKVSCPCMELLGAAASQPHGGKHRTMHETDKMLKGKAQPSWVFEPE